MCLHSVHRLLSAVVADGREAVDEGPVRTAFGLQVQLWPTKADRSGRRIHDGDVDCSADADAAAVAGSDAEA